MSLDLWELVLVRLGRSASCTKPTPKKRTRAAGIILAWWSRTAGADAIEALESILPWLRDASAGEQYARAGAFGAMRPRVMPPHTHWHLSSEPSAYIHPIEQLVAFIALALSE